MMVSIKLVVLVLFGLTLMVDWSEGIKVHVFPNEQLEVAFRAFQATEGVPVGGEKMLEYLKILLYFYQDQSDIADSAKFVELLKAGYLTITRCNHSALNKIDQMIEEWRGNINVEDYLQHYKVKLVEFCVPNSNDILTRHQELFNQNSARYTSGKKILTRLSELKFAMDKDPNNLLGLNRDRVNEFFECSQFDETKCNSDTVHSINSTISTLSDAEQTHIKPYLEYIIKQLDDFCNKKGKYAEGWRGWF